MYYKYNQGNTLQEDAALAVGTPAASRSEVEKTAADAVRPPDSNHSGIQVLNEAHDSWVQGDLDRALEYSEAHPGRVGEITVQERTLGVFTKDNGNEVIDALEKQGFETGQALTKICGRDVLAVWGKESIIRIKIKK